VYNLYQTINSQDTNHVASAPRSETIQAKPPLLEDLHSNLEDPEEQIGSRFELETLRRPAIATCYRLPRWK
jgi:hypothetical protein